MAMKSLSALVSEFNQNRRMHLGSIEDYAARRDRNAEIEYQLYRRAVQRLPKVPTQRKPTRRARARKLKLATKIYDPSQGGIQAFIDGSGVNDVLSFPGNYTLTSQVTFRSNRKYILSGKWSGSLRKALILLEANATGINISGGGTLDGGGFNAGTVSNTTITDMFVQNIPNGNAGDGAGIYFVNATNCTFTLNTFHKVMGWWCIGGYAMVGTSITYNLFDSSEEGCHIMQTALNAGGNVISFNKGNLIRRAFLEIQDQLAPGSTFFNGLTIEGNYTSNHDQYWTTQAGNEFSCAYSIPLQFSTNILFINNYCDESMAWSHEVCGNNVTCYGNVLGAKYAPGIFSPNIAGIDGVQSNITYGTAKKGNIFSACQGRVTLMTGNTVGSAIWGGKTSAGFSQQNNQIVATLPAVTPPNAGAGASSAFPTPTNFTATAGYSSTALLWGNPIGSTGTLIERRTVNGTYTTLATMAAGMATFTDDDFTADQIAQTWEFVYRATALGASGSSLPTVEQQVQIGLGTPTPPPNPTPVDPAVLVADLSPVNQELHKIAGELDQVYTNFNTMGEDVRRMATLYPNIAEIASFVTEYTNTLPQLKQAETELTSAVDSLDKLITEANT